MRQLLLSLFTDEEIEAGRGYVTQLTNAGAKIQALLCASGAPFPATALFGPYEPGRPWPRGRAAGPALSSGSCASPSLDSGGAVCRRAQGDCSPVALAHCYLTQGRSHPALNLGLRRLPPLSSAVSFLRVQTSQVLLSVCLLFSLSTFIYLNNW